MQRWHWCIVVGIYCASVAAQAAVGVLLGVSAKRRMRDAGQLAVDALELYVSVGLEYLSKVAIMSERRAVNEARLNRFALKTMMRLMRVEEALTPGEEDLRRFAITDDVPLNQDNLSKARKAIIGSFLATGDALLRVAIAVAVVGAL